MNVSRPLLFAFLFILLLANGLAPLAAQNAERFGFLTAALDLFGVGVVFVIAAAAVFTIGRDASGRTMSRWDPAMTAVLVLLALIPLHWMAKAGIALLATYLLATAPRYSPEWRIGFIAATVAAAFIAGALLLTAFAEPLLAADAAVVKLLTGATGYGNVVYTSDDRSPQAITHVIILGGCSSLRNLSQATILWAALTQLFGLRLNRRLLWTAIVAVVTVILINTARMALIVRLPDQYEFWHVGLGASLFSLATLIACFLIIGNAIQHETRRRP